MITFRHKNDPPYCHLTSPRRTLTFYAALDFIFRSDPLLSRNVVSRITSFLLLCYRLNTLHFCAPQTGMGRTGKVWGYENFGVEPDVITSAKVRFALPVAIVAYY